MKIKHRASTRPPRHQSVLTLAAATGMVVITFGLLAACSPKAPIPKGVSNTNLDLNVADLGDEWVVQSNQENSLILAPSDAERQGAVEILAGPLEEGINLVAAIDRHREHIESLPEGTYFGAQELAGPLGSAFYSRGRFKEGQSTIEETRIFALHPRSSRLIELVYRYPAGDDSSTRVGELIQLFGEVE